MLPHKVWHLLLLLLEVLLVIPTPPFDEVVDDELDAPAGFFMYFVDDCKHFLLLRAGHKTFACVMNRAESYTCDTSGIPISKYIMKSRNENSITDLSHVL